LNLYALHRWLIRVFIVAAVVFGVVMIRRWYAQRQAVELACAIGAFVVALVALAYLLTAPYLKKK
jgi:hypothetical protein